MKRNIQNGAVADSVSVKVNPPDHSLHTGVQLPSCTRGGNQYIHDVLRVVILFTTGDSLLVSSRVTLLYAATNATSIPDPQGGNAKYQTTHTNIVTPLEQGPCFLTVEHK